MELIAFGDACPKHGKSQITDRGSSCQRGYDYDWQKVREAYIARHPFCELKRACIDASITHQMAEHVHHRIGIKERPDMRLEHGNLMAVCRGCHGLLEREAHK
jgi:5-methylcytosine-specific restriction endonuclease McrA